MKKAMVLMMVGVLAAAAMAQDSIVISVDNSTPGELTINWDATGAADGGAVGFAIAVTCSVGVIDEIVDVHPFYDIYIDGAYYEINFGDGYTYGEGDLDDIAANPVVPGVIPLPASDLVLSFAGLGGTTPPPAEPPLVGFITIASTDGATVDIDTGSIRGGVVNKGGAMNVTGLPTTGIEINPEGCDCPGDVYPWGARDYAVTFDDLGELAYRLEIGGWFIQPGDANWDDCGDVYPPEAPDGYITFDDLGQLAFDLENTWFWYYVCF
ncbi:MAG: hypothetical protein JW709_06235 [Sedimentisphaerales bacterium]|nr:hypothetical protein [Sedimentisphaerales bacterium]